MDSEISYFVPGYGISRHIMFSHVHFYLGRDARVRPYQLRGREGFLVTATQELTKVNPSEPYPQSLRNFGTSRRVFWVSGLPQRIGRLDVSRFDPAAWRSPTSSGTQLRNLSRSPLSIDSIIDGHVTQPPHANPVPFGAPGSHATNIPS